jgi:hypothetical protein
MEQLVALLDAAIRQMEPRDWFSLLSAMVGIGGLVVAILARLQASKAFKLATAAEERAAYTDITQRLARKIYMRARAEFEWTREKFRLNPDKFEAPSDSVSIAIDENVDCDFDDVIAQIYEVYPDVKKVSPRGGTFTVDRQGVANRFVSTYFDVQFKDPDDETSNSES